MKKYIGICLLMIFSCTSFAQIQRTVVKQKTDSTATEPATVKSNNSRKEILKELNLTKEQKIKLREINQAMKVSKETIEADTNLSEPARKEKLKALKKEQASKIQAILTEEQRIKFRELRGKKDPNG